MNLEKSGRVSPVRPPPAANEPEIPQKDDREWFTSEFDVPQGNQPLDGLQRNSVTMGMVPVANANAVSENININATADPADQNNNNHAANENLLEYNKMFMQEPVSGQHSERQPADDDRKERPSTGVCSSTEVKNTTSVNTMASSESYLRVGPLGERSSDSFGAEPTTPRTPSTSSPT